MGHRLGGALALRLRGREEELLQPIHGVCQPGSHDGHRAGLFFVEQVAMLHFVLARLKIRVLCGQLQQQLLSHRLCEGLPYVVAADRDPDGAPGVVIETPSATIWLTSTG